MLSWIYDCLLSIVTRSSQAQRILLNLDIFDYLISIFRDLEPVSFKVHDPAVLSEFQSYCQSNLRPEILSELQNGSKDHETLTDSVMECLEIDPKYRHLVLDAVVQMCKFYSDLKAFDETSLVQVSEDIKEHCKLLNEVWNHLENRAPPKSFRKSKSDDPNSWGCLGFQMPMSDFRKTGLLGLRSLHFMASSFTELSREALELSRREDSWFPFSLTSINVTSWVLDWFNENRLNAFSYNNPADSLHTFYMLHSYFFFNFVQFYLANDYSILDFNLVSNEYKVELNVKLKRLMERRYRDVPDELYGAKLVDKLAAELHALNLR